MATVKKVSAKTKPVEKVIEDEKVVLTLTPNEAAGLRTLLFCGTHVDTLASLDLRDINGALYDAGVLDLHPFYRDGKKRFGLNLAELENYRY